MNKLTKALLSDLQNTLDRIKKCDSEIEVVLELKDLEASVSWTIDEIDDLFFKE